MGKREQIAKSYRAFDIYSPLTQFEEQMVGILREERAPAPAVRVKDLEEDTREPLDTETKVDDYNAAYVQWTRCQALTALQSYSEGWKAFEDLVLAPYVQAKRQESDAYIGTDRDEVFARKLRLDTARDFVKHIYARMAEAASVSKPAE